MAVWLRGGRDMLEMVMPTSPRNEEGPRPTSLDASRRRYQSIQVAVRLDLLDRLDAAARAAGLSRAAAFRRALSRGLEAPTEHLEAQERAIATMIEAIRSAALSLDERVRLLPTEEDGGAGAAGLSEARRALSDHVATLAGHIGPLTRGRSTYLRGRGC